MRIRYKQLLLGLVSGALAFIASSALIAHGCTRNSTIMDIVVASAVVVVFIVLPATRKSVKSSVLWCALALPLTLVITFGYHTWLHADGFPDRLLDKQRRPARREFGHGTNGNPSASVTRASHNDASE